MPYLFFDNEPVDDAVRRMALELVQQAIDEVTSDTLGPHETIHEVRKRCKEFRGLIRLVRPALGDTYAFENTRFRDAARPISAIRDATARLETYDALMDRFSTEIERRAFGPLRRALTWHRRDLVDSMDLESRLSAFLVEMQQAQQRIPSWSLKSEGFEALSGGLEKTYHRGRKAMAKAYASPSAEHFHAWRKRVKYHWYHSLLLQRIWPPLMNPWIEAMHQLSDLLGDDHDLAVFRKTVIEHPDRYSNISSLSAFLGLLNRRQEELRTQAQPLGQRLFAEKPASLSQRWNVIWGAWQQESSKSLPS